MMIRISEGSHYRILEYFRCHRCLSRFFFNNVTLCFFYIYCHCIQWSPGKPFCSAAAAIGLGDGQLPCTVGAVLTSWFSLDILWKSVKWWHQTHRNLEPCAMLTTFPSHNLQASLGWSSWWAKWSRGNEAWVSAPALASALASPLSSASGISIIIIIIIIIITITITIIIIIIIIIQQSNTLCPPIDHDSFLLPHPSTASLGPLCRRPPAPARPRGSTP